MRKLSVYVLMAAMVLLTGAANASVAVNSVTKGKPVSETCTLTNDQRQCTVPLVAGQSIVVGEVVVDLGGDPVVRFSITNAGWMITETHVYLGENPPKKAAPGSFPFQHSGLYANTDEYSSAEIGEIGGCQYAAVHAVVEKDCVETADLEAVSELVTTANDLGTAKVTATYTGASGDSYWSMLVSGANDLDGSYPAWCVDKSNGLASGSTCDAELYSSYDSLPDFIKARLNPAQLDMVNYILNQEWTCDALEVQNALWAALGQLTDEEFTQLSPCAQSIYNEAFGASTGYVPPCGGVVGIIIAPNCANSIGQILIGQITAIELDVTECVIDTECGEETAWGLADHSNVFGDAANSCQFPKSTGWGTYFKCCENFEDE